jgi:hypothetical protein
LHEHFAAGGGSRTGRPFADDIATSRHATAIVKLVVALAGELALIAVVIVM